MSEPSAQKLADTSSTTVPRLFRKNTEVMLPLNESPGRKPGNAKQLDHALFRFSLMRSKAERDLASGFYDSKYLP
jgi:hypothetical protein